MHTKDADNTRCGRPSSDCPHSVQATLNGELAAVAYLAHIKGSGTGLLSVTALTTHLAMHIKDFLYHVEEQNSRLFAGTAIPGFQSLKRAYIVSTIAHAKWKEFSRALFPTGFVGTHAAEGAEASVQLSFELGWMLFAIAKAVAPAPLHEPMAAYHLLAGVIHLLLAHLVEEVPSAPKRALHAVMRRAPRYAQPRLCRAVCRPFAAVGVPLGASRHAVQYQSPPAQQRNWISFESPPSLPRRLRRLAYSGHGWSAPLWPAHIRSRPTPRPTSGVT